MEQAHKAVNSAEQAVRSATDQVSRAAHDAVESLRDYSERAEEQLRDVGARSREIIDQVSEYIERHPMAALGIAAAVGFTLGALAGRQSGAESSHDIH